MARNQSKDGIREIILEDGTRRYEARIHRVGEKQISKRFDTRKAALAWKRSVDGKVDHGRPVVDNKTVLVSKIIDDFLGYKEKSLTPLPSNQITEYERVKLDLGDFAISKLDRSDIENWIKLLLTTSRGKLKNGKDKGSYAEASVRRFYYAFKTAAEWHSTEYRYYVSEFLFKLPKGSVPSAWGGKRNRRLSPAEEVKLYEAGIERAGAYTKTDWQRVIGFALETAMREQEIVFARWQDLIQGGYKLFVPKEHSKTGKDRIVLLSGRARELVAQQKEECPGEDVRIFFQIPSPPALCRAFAQLTKRAHVSDLHFHDLRHEATSRLCERGELNMMQIMEMTGHSSMATFQGYLHLLKHESSITLK